MEAEELVHRLARAYLHRRMERQRRERRPPPPRAALPSSAGEGTWLEPTEERSAWWADARKERSEAAESRERLWAGLEVEARGLLARAGASLEGEPFEQLCAELLRVERWVHRIAEQERAAESTGDPRPALGAESAVPVASGRSARGPGSRARAPRPLSEVIRAFADANEGTRWRPRTAATVRKTLAQLVEVVGDKPVRRITREDVARYRCVLERLPSRRRRRPEAPSVDAEGEPARPRLSAATIDTRLGHVRRLFRFAEERGWIDEGNPAEGPRPAGRPSAAKADRRLLLHEEASARGVGG